MEGYLLLITSPKSSKCILLFLEFCIENNSLFYSHWKMGKEVIVWFMTKQWRAMDPIPGWRHILLCIAVFKVLSQCTAVCDVNPVINPLLFLVWSYNVDQITTIFPLLGTVTLKKSVKHTKELVLNKWRELLRGKEFLRRSTLKSLISSVRTLLSWNIICQIK